MADAARDNAAPQKSIASQLLVQTQQSLADAKTVRMRNGETRVVTNHAKVGHMIVKSFHFQQNHTQIVGAGGYLTASQLLHGLTIGQRVTDGRVARNALGQFHAGSRRAPLEELLRAFMREVEPNLQIDHS